MRGFFESKDEVLGVFWSCKTLSYKYLPVLYCNRVRLVWSGDHHHSVRQDKQGLIVSKNLARLYIAVD